MIVLADSGSTKTTWRFCESSKVKTVKTSGINPYYLSQAEIEETLRKELVPMIGDPSSVSFVFFYGAGLGNEDRKRDVYIPLHFVFRHASIEVDHDLMAAARALLGHASGIACIAGTGSNSCYYDGRNIIENVTSLGLYLGDEGSGGYKGKLLITDYLRNKLPGHLKERFEETYKDRTADILDKIYKKPMPNRYLASFMSFILEHQQDEYIQNLISRSFRAFIEENVARYSGWRDEKIAFVGSVAYLCLPHLQKLAGDMGFELGQVIQDPINALTDFHSIK